MTLDQTNALTDVSVSDHLPHPNKQEQKEELLTTPLPTTQITQLKAEEERRHPNELEVDNTEAAQEEADDEDDDDEEPAKQNTTLAEESNQTTEEAQKTW